MSDTVERLDPYSFKTLKDTMLEVISRGGDGSLGTSGDALAGKYLNAAENFICMKIGAPWFLQHSDTETLSAGDEDVTFPINVADVVDIWDAANIQKLSYMDRSNWNSYVVKPSSATGNPAVWTKWGYTRRDNSASPSTEYGQMKIKVWPVPTGSFTLNYDCILRPGTMFNDTDQPVIPIEWHFGLIQVAIMLAGPRDIGIRTYREYAELAREWVRDITREDRRNLSGNLRLIPREEDRRRTRGYGAPLTRRAQLYGGQGW